MRGIMHNLPPMPHDDADLIRSMEALIEHFDRITELAARLAEQEKQDAELVAT